MCVLASEYVVLRNMNIAYHLAVDTLKLKGSLNKKGVLLNGERKTEKVCVCVCVCVCDRERDQYHIMFLRLLNVN